MTHARVGAVLRPTAGALHLVEDGTTHPRSIDITGYVQRMTAFCPYLAPSLARGHTTWTVYRAVGDAAAVEAEIFHAGVQAAERVRFFLLRSHESWRCENVVILGEVPGTRHRDVMAWPHWALKHLYGPVGLMFGKFYEGEEEMTGAGTRIPAAPVSFLPVRAAVRRRDHRFLGATPALAAALATASDDGRDVFEHLPCDWTEIHAWAKHLLRPQPSASLRSTSANPARPGS